MEEIKTEEKEERITIPARVLEEVLLRFLGSYLVIKQIIMCLPLVFAGKAIFHDTTFFILSFFLPLLAGVFLIAVPGKWICITRFLRK